jgi:hypothetical protein
VFGCVALACATLGAPNAMAQKRVNRPWVPPPSPSSRDRGGRSRDHHATEGALWDCQRRQCRDDGARALRAVFSSHDNWLDLSEGERDEWRGYFDRMLERLHHLGYTPKRNPWSILLEASTAGAGPSDAGAS